MSQYWQIRIKNANKFYTKWEDVYKCDRLEDYFRGKQWKTRQDIQTLNYNPYVLNLFYSTIKSKLATLIFQKPSFLISAKPGISDWNLDFAAQSAELKEAVLNTLVQNPQAKFVASIKRAAKDSFSRFGLIEVGYAADWRNPLKADVLLSDHGEEPEDDPKVKEDEEVPVNERMYFKRINPKRFRVSVSDAMDLCDHDWCGYYDFFSIKQLKATKGIKFPEEYTSDLVSADFSDIGIYSSGDGQKPDFVRLLAEGGICKVWHIWDLNGKKRLLLLDNTFDELWSEDCDRVPFVDLRWDEDYEGFYPIPPAFQWLSPQDEINEAREQARSFRRRFTRKFQSIRGAVEEEEKEKFASGPDGVIIEVKEKDAISPIANPEMGQTAANELPIAKDDFYTISGNSANIQASDRQTATASKIVDVRTQIRESAEQMDFSTWLCAIARETLTQAQEKIANGLWVKFSTNPDEQTAMTEVQQSAAIYKHVLSQQISDGYDYEVDVDVMNQTPAALQQQQQSFLSFLQTLHVYPEIALSPTLIRKAALVSGMRDEKIIHQMQQVAVLAMAAKASQAAGQNGQSLTQATQSTLDSQMQSPTNQQVETQISNQLQ